jgi:type I restriction enzyme, S subunit
MKYPRYSKYKASGVEWLGEVPEHWNQTMLKGFARKGRKTFTDGDWVEAPYITDEGVRLIQTGNIGIGVYKEQGFRFISKETFLELGCTEVQPGDVLICRLDGPVGRACLAPDLGLPMVTSVDNAILKTDEETDPRYLVFVMSCSFWLGWFQTVSRAGGGFRFRISRGMLGDTVIPRPPLPEQQTIANFLDTQTAKLDTLLSKKQQLIERLREKRTALISRTVTRGLPPEVARAAGLAAQPRMKPSGVEWLGEVPEHWEVITLKRTWSSCEYGISETLSGDGPIRVLTMSHIQEGRVLIPDEGCIEEVSEELLLKNKDLLFNRTNSLAHVGKVGLYKQKTDEPVTFASYLVRIRTNDSTTPEFMNFLLNMSQLLEFIRGLALPSINQANLNPTRYGQIHIPLPPVPEQQTIVAYLDRETSKLDRMVEKVEAAIEKLKEYRSALITAAVTGKIDLSPNVAPLRSTLP